MVFNVHLKQSYVYYFTLMIIYSTHLRRVSSKAILRRSLAGFQTVFRVVIGSFRELHRLSDELYGDSSRVWEVFQDVSGDFSTFQSVSEAFKIASEEIQRGFQDVSRGFHKVSRSFREVSGILGGLQACG